MENNILIHTENAAAPGCGVATIAQPQPEQPKPQAPPILMDMWNSPLVVSKNNFVNKSLSMWACNTVVGCSHGCNFCYVPNTSTKFLNPKLKERGVQDPDAEWGAYAFLRPWDEGKFLASVLAAENTSADKLNLDGNRAVMFCTTTDPYQVFKGPNGAALNAARANMVRRAYEIIRDNSTVNIRILTRSPLVRQDFELLRTLGDRVLIGSSISTLDNDLARIYEPHAPAPTQRFAMLKEARKAGLNVFVALAPVYAECDEADLRATLQAIAEVEPVTIFMEPINIRAENVERIATHARTIGREINTEVFQTPEAWFRYSMEQLFQVQRLATELGLLPRLHLWPDAGLKAKGRFREMRRAEFLRVHGDVALNSEQRSARKALDEAAYLAHTTWLEAWWNRISEWPGTQNPAPWTPPALPATSPLTPPSMAELVGQLQ